MKARPVINKTSLYASVAIVVVLVAAVAGYYYYAGLFFNESLYVEKDTYEYDLLISESVKQLPVFKAIDHSVKYHYSAGDGNKPQSDSLEFESEAQTDAILEFYSAYFQEHGYSAQQAEHHSENNVIYGNRREVFNVYVENADNTRQVSIYHLQTSDGS